MNNPGLPNQTGAEMLDDIAFFQQNLKPDSGLTEDARGPVESALAAKTERFNRAANYARALEAAGVVFNSSENNADTDPEILHPDLTPEQRKHAQEVISAMREKYPEKSFELIKLPSEESEEKQEGPESTNRFIVICTDQAGIDLGNPDEDFDYARSRRSIMADPNDKRFIIKTSEGKTYDSRKGMTLEAYRALAQHCRDAGKPLPDTDEVRIGSTDQGTLSTWTTLTGDVSAGVNGPIAGVQVGSVVNHVTSVNYDCRVIRFRPAVMLQF